MTGGLMSVKTLKGVKKKVTFIRVSVDGLYRNKRWRRWERDECVHNSHTNCFYVFTCL